MKSRFFLIACIVLLLSSCSTPKTGGTYKPTTEYENVTSSVTANQESTVQLSDGAQITIPENSLTGDSTVTIERNASKTASMPPLGDKDLPLSDFYNFQIEGGQLIGPVDLVIPFDESKLPKQDGFLVAMIPTAQGWKYVPVETFGNKANLYTTELGDPLIAWHFVCLPGRIDLSYPGSPDKCNSEEGIRKQADAGLLLCDPKITLSTIIDDQNKTVQIVGRLVPLTEKYFGVTERKPASSVQVSILLNDNFVGVESKEFKATTDANGNFSITLDAKDPSTRLKDGFNRISATAKCDPWFGEIAVESSGWDDGFRLHLTETAEAKPPIVAEPPASQPQPISPPKSPTDKIPVPNVIGINFEDAQKILEDLGFNTTWIDGKSKLELGKIYSQSPIAGTLSVPHRTTVVIYRTTEVVTTPPECAQLNLTPEECANAGKHLYSSGEITKYIDGVETNGTIHVCSNPTEAFLQAHEWWFFSSPTNAIDPTYKKSGDNLYSQYDTWGPSGFATIEFTADGFIFKYFIEEQLCTETIWTRIEN
jgi:hypothetical protein